MTNYVCMLVEWLAEVRWKLFDYGHLSEQSNMLSILRPEGCCKDRIKCSGTRTRKLNNNKTKKRL